MVVIRHRYLECRHTQHPALPASLVQSFGSQRLLQSVMRFNLRNDFFVLHHRFVVMLTNGLLSHTFDLGRQNVIVEVRKRRENVHTIFDMNDVGCCDHHTAAALHRRVVQIAIVLQMKLSLCAPAVWAFFDYKFHSLLQSVRRQLPLLVRISPDRKPGRLQVLKCLP